MLFAMTVMENFNLHLTWIIVFKTPLKDFRLPPWYGKVAWLNYCLNKGMEEKHSGESTFKTSLEDLWGFDL